MKVLEGSSGATSAGWSMLKDFLRCPKAYQLKYLRGVHHPLHREPDHFAIGSLLHAGRAKWFAAGFKSDPKTWALCRDAILREEEHLKLPATLRAGRVALNMMEQYIRHWSVRPLPKTVATEYLLGPAPLFEGDPKPLWRTSKPDDVSKYPEGGNELWLGDLKTSSGDVSDVIRDYELNGQFMIGMLLWKSSPQGERKLGKAAGYMLDIAIKPKGDGKAKFARYAVRVTDWSLQWFAESMRGALRQMSMLTPDGPAPRFPTGCTIAGTRSRVDCEFKKLCQFGRSARGTYVKANGQPLTDEDCA